LRILLLSDIHANLEALDACLAAAPAHDLVINLGDVVGYGANPNEVTDISRKISKYVVRGNHDKAVVDLMDVKQFNPIAAMAALWTRDKLTPENLEWLRQLPQGPLRAEEGGDMQFVHGSPLDEDEYLVSVRDAMQPLMASTVAVTFFGHTHVQGGFFWDQEDSDMVVPQYPTRGGTDNWALALDRKTRYLINPGSVGQPRDGDWRSAFAIFDADQHAVEFHRVPYDLKTAQEKILAEHLPQRLATRLAAGR
jgi:diadenosine tetraphosphatase ApaH/serine/threonine PP2A family protein phosphatase